MDQPVTTMAEGAKRKLHPALKLALELGPLILFFVANARFGIFVGTAAFMVAVLIAFAVSYALTRHIPLMALISAAVVLVFGGLTLLLQDETFIKLKPTIIYLLFGSVLIAGLAAGKPLLAVVFDSVFNLTEPGWRKLTLRWALFFFALALVNEIVWRTQTTEFWLGFKAFGVIPLTFVFAALQYPLLMKYDAGAPEAAPAAAEDQAL
jgi:intracellular septation protein